MTPTTTPAPGGLQVADYCPTCDERTSLTSRGKCPWCSSRLYTSPAEADRVADAAQDAAARRTSMPSRVSAAPERSLAQRMDALQRANEVRTRRAQLKRDLKAGRTDVVGLLSDPPEYLETAKVFDMLLAVPKFGRVKVNKLLVQSRISPSKTIGGLTGRQRGELAGLIRSPR